MVDTDFLIVKLDFLTYQPTMAGFGDFCLKTQAWNLALAGPILFKFQKSKNLAHDPQFFEPWEQECLEKEWK